MMKEEIGLFLIFLAILIFKLSFIDDELDFAEKVKEFLIASLSMGLIMLGMRMAWGGV
ncbi:hypothetical protein [Blautia wexlerae]|uniref:hypothetical protein n=1 Tax=Blautia wexlerae TaxID=418240 RepID=UPI00156E720D|nr:hypothetical protein [Blautia wexlerae]NSG63719.1 hypothetical protein [Blautia wexlerae]